jgi:hypothetical protein
MKKGDSVFIRTVTHYYTGRIRRITRSWIVLDEVTHVFDTGSFESFFRQGNASIAERLPDGWCIARNGITDGGPWAHSLPLKAKT